MYKIYRKGDYFVINATVRNEFFYGNTDEVFVDKSNVDRDVYRIFNVKDFRNSLSIPLSQITKEDGTAYSKVEWETFYTELKTGSAKTETAYKLISTASTNANVVKSSNCNLTSIIAIGLTSDVRYLKLYNKATAPTVGTDIPEMTIAIPTNTQGAGVAIPFSKGVNFSSGLSIAITSGASDNDTGAVGAEDVIVNLTYA